VHSPLQFVRLGQGDELFSDGTVGQSAPFGDARPEVIPLGENGDGVDDGGFVRWVDDRLELEFREHCGGVITHNAAVAPGEAPVDGLGG
jgi:hypothetical protein